MIGWEGRPEMTYNVLSAILNPTVPSGLYRVSLKYMMAVQLLTVVGAACHGFSKFSYTVMAPRFSDVELVNVPCTVT